ncbi:hypothetical protein CDD82_6048 [Ophiocordyceps australis]|uniref:Uncharacterized protein n=1 Tax=Ophiocordyceps australis TaxID=1399860 RepID=A0A2C5YXD2_9HYPO|nr:hypothetical protein CDD82_6048 [Ophiocordyceps australis]
MAGQDLVRRCSGWSCLTWVSKFAIGFGIAVVSLVLFVLWFYCCGKALAIRQARTSIVLPGGRRVFCRQEQPRTVCTGVLPVVQQWPGYPARVVYHPAVFRLDRFNDPRATATVLPYSRGVVHAMTGSAPLVQQPGGAGSLSTRPDDIVWSASSPGQPIWGQALMRALGLPVGRASTVASTSSGETSRGSRGSTGSLESVPRHVIQEHATDADADGDANSVHTNAATVDSDDFQMAVQS